MYDILQGVRVVEVSSWLFLPAAGAVLADWGADVVKVEDPVTGDPQRGLASFLTTPSGFNPVTSMPNRGKRSVGIDIANVEGREILLDLVREADVFTTNFMPGSRERLGIDAESLRSVNPRLIYCLGTGQGSRGPDANNGGFDLASTWARAGIAARMTPDGGVPPMMPGSVGDLMGGITAAGAVAAALFARERDGRGRDVEVSLFAVGMWMMSQSITAAPFGLSLPLGDRTTPPNPIVNCYRTLDDRWIWLVMMQADRFWGPLCERLGRPDLVADERFVDMASRAANLGECIQELDATFAARDLGQWLEILEGFDGVWAPVRSVDEVVSDPQTLANGYFTEIIDDGDEVHRVVASPAQFDGQVLGPLNREPGHGEHTEAVLLELGLSWDRIAELKDRKAVL